MVTGGRFSPSSRRESGESEARLAVGGMIGWVIELNPKVRAMPSKTRYAMVVVAALCATAASAQERFVAFGGVDATTRTDVVGYAGGVAMLTGTLTTDSVVVKPFFFGGSYEGAAGGGSGNYGASLSAGYQVFFGGVRLTPYAGVEVQRQTDDGTGTGQGATKTGAKLELDLRAAIDDRFHVAGIAQYTTSWSQVWTRARAGYAIAPGGPAIGPEFVYARSDLFEQFRVGAFMETIRIGDRVSGGFNAGASFNTRGQSTTSAYLGLALGVGF